MMFDKKEYIEVFSHVTASRKIRQEVMNMEKQKKTKRGGFGRRITVLVAAVIVLAAMTVTAFAAEDIALWFRSFFDNRNEQTLSDGQLAYLEENEQIIGQAKEIDGWTVELRSVLHDEKMGYIILGVTGPEDAVLQPELDENQNRIGDFNFGNFTHTAFKKGTPELVTPSKGVAFGSWGVQWTEDGDGLANTKNFVITLNPDFDRSSVDPFGQEASYTIHIEDIVWEYQNTLLYQELLKGENSGSAHVMVSGAQSEALYCEELLADGIWEFTVSFTDGLAEGGEYVELISEPVSTLATVIRDTGDGIGDFEYVDRKVSLTSVQMRHLTVSFCCGDAVGFFELNLEEDGAYLYPCVVLSDGREIRLLPYGTYTAGEVILEAESPIVFEEVSHIRMADGTIIPMPETE